MSRLTNGNGATTERDARSRVESAERAISEYDSEVTTALRKLHRRTGSGEAVEEKTPLDAIFAIEAAAKCHNCGVPVESDHDLEEWGVRNETIRRVAAYCAQDGLQPWNVVRNLYAIFSHMGLAPWTHLTVREKGLILGESHGSSHFRMQLMCVNKLRRAGAHSVNAPGQKGSSASAAASAAQQGNSNRKRKKIRSRHRRHKPGKPK